MTTLVEANGIDYEGFETVGGATHKASSVVRPAVMDTQEIHVQQGFVFTSRYEPSVSLYQRDPLAPPMAGQDFEYGHQNLVYEYRGAAESVPMGVAGFDVNRMKTTLVANSYYWTE